MVYKTQKHGIRTGSSVKNWNSSDFRYMRVPYLQITVRPCSHEIRCSECKTGDLCKYFTKCQYKCVLNGVDYSLNKRRRWELEQYMQEGILDVNCIETKHVIQLVIRHNVLCLPGTSTCIYACSSRGVFKDGAITKDCQVKRKKHGYFNADSVLDDKVTRRGQKKSIGLKAHSKTESQVVVRYDFVYPSHANKQLTHIPGPNYNSSDKHYNFQEDFNRQRRKKRLRRWINESITDMVR